MTNRPLRRSASPPLGQADRVHRSGAGAKLAQTPAYGLPGDSARDARRLLDAFPERQARRQRRRMRAARSVRRAVGVARTLDLDHSPPAPPDQHARHSLPRAAPHPPPPPPPPHPPPPHPLAL